MKASALKSLLIGFALVSITASAQVATPTHRIEQTFTIPTPNYKTSPYPQL